MDIFLIVIGALFIVLGVAQMVWPKLTTGMYSKYTPESIAAFTKLNLIGEVLFGGGLILQGLFSGKEGFQGWIGFVVAAAGAVITLVLTLTVLKKK